MSRKITQDELETYLWGSAVLLRNHIDAGAYSSTSSRSSSSND